jgi:hypothetical protein
MGVAYDTTGGYQLNVLPTMQPLTLCSMEAYIVARALPMLVEQ